MKSFVVLNIYNHQEVLDGGRQDASWVIHLSNVRLLHKCTLRLLHYYVLQLLVDGWVWEQTHYIRVNQVTNVYVSTVGHVLLLSLSQLHNEFLLLGLEVILGFLGVGLHFFLSSRHSLQKLVTLNAWLRVIPIIVQSFNADLLQELVLLRHRVLNRNYLDPNRLFVN